MIEKLEKRLSEEGLKIRKDLNNLSIQKIVSGKKKTQVEKYLVKTIFKADKSIERLEGSVPVCTRSNF